MKNKEEVSSKKQQQAEEKVSVFDNKQFEQAIMEHVRSNGGTAQIGGAEFVQGLVKSALQALLKVEMEEHLEGEDKNHRNGYGKKTVKGDFGAVELETPRDRNATFSPQIVKKRETELGNFSEKIISLYCRGMSTREIEDHLREMYGIDVSHQFISRATESIQQEVVEWQNRSLETLYPVVYIDGLRVSVKVDGNSSKVIKKCVYTVLGVRLDVQQEVLGLWIEETEGARFWLKVFTDLKARGVIDILLLCSDGLKGIDSALESVFPQTDLQLCVVHQIRNACKFVPWKDRKTFCAAMKPLYASPTVEAATAALEIFTEEWSKKYPTAVESWRRNFDKLTTFYRYPLEIRQSVYTTNSIESLHSQMRKNIANRKVFPSDEALIKLLYLNIKNITKKWTFRKNWSTVVNQFSILFPERFNAASDSL